MLGLRERMEENGSAPGTGEAKRSAAAPADPEVVDRPLRRRFSPSYKLRIVEEADRCIALITILAGTRKNSFLRMLTLGTGM